MSTQLYKTTIVILSDYDPTNRVEIDVLAQEAMYGAAYCIEKSTVPAATEDIDSGVRDFFNMDEDGDEDTEEPQ